LRITSGFPLLVPCFVLFGPGAALLASTIGYAAMMVVYKFEALFMAYANGQIAASVYAATLVMQVAGFAIGPLDVPAAIVRYVVAALAFDVFNIGFASARVSIEQNDRWLRRWLSGLLRDRGWVLPAYHGLGLVAVLLIQAYGISGLVVACLPSIGLHLFLSLQVRATQARQAAVVDRLTGVGNYRALSDRLAQQFDRAVAHSRHLALLWVDVDGLKAVNDSLGHEAGNLVLSEVAATLRAHSRAADDVARYGGDEFVIMLPDTKLPAARRAAARLMQLVSESVLDYQGQALRPSISIGAAVYPDDGATAAELLKAADLAMYEVKEQRRAARLAAGPAKEPAGDAVPVG
jgi:diguanylate cyclase (GGDEF)-like protein